MNFLAWLCVAATVLIADGFTLTSIGDTSDHMYRMSKRNRCIPANCVVQGGRICICDGNGTPICHQLFFTDKLSCYCQPGELLMSDVRCLCPRSGIVTSDDCPYGFRPPTPLSDHRGNVRTVEGDNKRQLTPAVVAVPPVRVDCGYWHCEPHGPHSQVCIWIKCEN